MSDLKGLVKPLEWLVYHNGNGYRQYRSGSYEITANCLSYRDATGSFAIGGKRHETLEAAKSAAQADYEARILAALDLAKVEALVEALSMQTCIIEEFCTAVDCEAEGIGGQRPSGTILREIGPANNRACAVLAAMKG